MERNKTRNYLNACLNKQRHFTPFFASVYGLLRVKAEATLKNIASRLSQNWQELESPTYGYVKSRVPITLVRATHRYIRGARVLASYIGVTRPQWEDIAGLNLFR